VNNRTKKSANGLLAVGICLLALVLAGVLIVHMPGSAHTRFAQILGYAQGEEEETLDSGAGETSAPDGETSAPESSAPTVPDSSAPSEPESSEPTVPESSAPTTPETSAPTAPPTEPVQPVTLTFTLGEALPPHSFAGLPGEPVDTATLPAVGDILGENGNRWRLDAWASELPTVYPEESSTIAAELTQVAHITLLDADNTEFFAAYVPVAEELDPDLTALLATAPESATLVWTQGDTLLASLLPYTVTADDATFTAAWQADYTVRFVTQAAPNIPAKEVKTVTGTGRIGEIFTRAEILAQISDKPEITGFTLDETGADFTLPSAAEERKVSFSLTRNYYDLVYQNYDGEELERVAVQFGFPVPAATATPTRTGYSFTHWATEQDADTAPCPDACTDVTFGEGYTMGAEELTLWAHFDPRSDTAYSIALVGESLTAGVYDVPLQTLTRNDGVSDALKTYDEDWLSEVAAFPGFLLQGVETDELPIAADGSTVFTVRFKRLHFLFQYVALDTNGGEVFLVDESVPFGAVPPTAPETTERPKGHRFVAWPDAPATMPADFVKLVANYTPDSYVVTYKNADGTDFDTASVTFGEAIPAPTNGTPVRTGYSFTHWATEQDNDTAPCPDECTDVTFGESYTLTEEGLTLWAHFDPRADIGYKVVLVGEKIAVGEYDYATPLLTLTRDDGTADAVKAYDAAWLDAVDAFPGYRYGGAELAEQTIAPDGSSVFYVRFARLNYALTLVQEGDAQKGQEYSVRWGTPLSSFLADYIAAAADKTNAQCYILGHGFDRWLDSEGAAYDASAKTMPIGGLTLQAAYKALPWNAKFTHLNRTAYANAETTLTATVSTVFGEPITPPTPRRYGYTFTGWKDDTTGTLYQPDALVMDTEGRSFTAQWSVNKYSATFEYQDNDGTIIVTKENIAFDSNIDYTSGKTYYFPVIDQTSVDSNGLENGRVKDGYALTGWTWTDPTGAVRTELPTARPKITVEGDMTFTAVYARQSYQATLSWTDGKTENTKTFAIPYNTSIDTFIENSGFVWLWYKTDSNKVTNNLPDYNKAAANNRAKVTGNSIDGWEEQLPNGTDNDYQSFGTMGHGKVTFKAKISPQAFNAVFKRFDDISGAWVDVATVQNVTYGTNISVPDKSKIVGAADAAYFDGWSKSDALAGALIPGSKTATTLPMDAEGVTYYARLSFPVKYYTVFNNAETLLKESLVPQRTSIVHPTAPAKEGYHFGAWDQPDRKIMPAQSLRFTGAYLINQFTIAFKYKDLAGNWVTSGASPYKSFETIRPGTGVPTTPDTNTEKFTGWSGNIVPGSTKAVGAEGANLLYTAQYRKAELQKIEATLGPDDDYTISQGRSFDLVDRGLIVTATYDNGGLKTEKIVVTPPMINNGTVSYTPKSFDKTGDNQYITVTYKSAAGETASAKIKVWITPRRVASIKIAQKPTKTTYIKGEKLDLTGGLLEINYNNGTRTTNTPLTLKTATESVVVANFSSSTLGKRTLTVTYTNESATPYTTSFDVTVIEKAADWLKGDVNNDKKVNSLDILLVKRHILEISALKNQAFKAGDVNGDGKINSLDLMKILRHVLEIERLK
jgi:uncharacterized repeat protein (TIGR02543 family)